MPRTKQNPQRLSQVSRLQEAHVVPSTKQNPLRFSKVSRCSRSPCCALNELKSVSLPACPNDSAPAPWPNRMSAGIQKWRPRQPRPNCFQTFVPGLKVTVEEKKMETKTPTFYTCKNQRFLVVSNALFSYCFQVQFWPWARKIKGF